MGENERFMYDDSDEMKNVIDAVLPKNKCISKARKCFFGCLNYLKHAFFCYLKAIGELLKKRCRSNGEPSWISLQVKNFVSKALPNYITHSKDILFYYLDVLKDSIVLYEFYRALEDPTKIQDFRVQLLLALVATTLLPLVINGLYIVTYHSRVIFNETEICWYHRIVGLLLFPFLPGIIIYRKNEIDLDMNTVFEETIAKCKNSKFQASSLAKEIQQVHSNLAKKKFLENLVLEMKALEISLENTIQSSIQLVFAFLILSTTQAEPPLTVFAGETEKHWLYISSVWAILIHALVCVKAEVGQKYVKLVSKVLIGVKGLLFSTTRIMAIVTFLTPIMGLFDILAHWKREQVPFEEKVFPRNFPYTVGTTLLYKDFTEIERGNYTDYNVKLPVPSLYSGDRNLWILFLGLVHCAGLIFLIFVKMCTSAKFNFEVRNGKLTKPILHIFGMLNMSLLYSDFEEETKVNIFLRLVRFHTI